MRLGLGIILPSIKLKKSLNSIVQILNVMGCKLKSEKLKQLKKMGVRLSFDPSDHDQCAEVQELLKTTDRSVQLYDIYQKCRNLLKHGDTSKMTEGLWCQFVEEIKAMAYEE